MRNGRRLVMVAAMMGVLAGGVWGQPYAEKVGERPVGRVLATWKDAKREREVPVLIDYPKDLGKDGEAAPVIVFSHGLGGDRLGYEAYGKQWASYGYVVVFPQHHGSDYAAVADVEAVRKGATRLQDEVKAFVDRVGDIHFVIDQVEAMNAGKLEGKEYDAFKGKLDMKKVGMAGHSFGAITTQAVVGQSYEVPVKGTTFTDSRVVAGVAMSPYPPVRRGEDLDAAFGGIRVPVFYMTGTLDTVVARAEDRRVPYDHSKTVGTMFLNFLGGTHMTFSPRRVEGTGEKAVFQKIICEATTAYWDAYLKGDGKAKAWLVTELAAEVGKLGTVEERK